MEDFISSKNIRNYNDCKQIIIRKDMIITPSAKDIARDLGIRIIHEDSLPDMQSGSLNESDKLKEPLQDLELSNSMQGKNVPLENLEKHIESIVRQILSSKSGQPKLNEQTGKPGQLVMMINFLEDRDIEKSVILHILENGFIINNLHTYSASGIQFMNLVLKDTFVKASHEKFVASLKAKFPVNVLLS